MELGRYLTANDLNSLKSNINKIQHILNHNGYSIVINHPFDDVFNKYKPGYMLNLFNDVEQELQDFDDGVDWINPFSGKKIWKKSNGTLYTGVKRWFDWYEFNQAIVSGQHQKTDYLKSTQYNKLIDIYDNEGNKIICLNGYFEQIN